MASVIGKSVTILFFYDNYPNCKSKNCQTHNPNDPSWLISKNCPKIFKSYNAEEWFDLMKVSDAEKAMSRPGSLSERTQI